MFFTSFLIKKKPSIALRVFDCCVFTAEIREKQSNMRKSCVKMNCKTIKTLNIKFVFYRLKLCNWLFAYKVTIIDRNCYHYLSRLIAISKK